MADQAFRQRLAKIISKGLVKGLGEPKPGKLCVEAAVVLAREASTATARLASRV